MQTLNRPRTTEATRPAAAGEENRSEMPRGFLRTVLWAITSTAADRRRALRL
jgi:hypothetical protein